jgi:hypothetical protein
MVIVCGMSTCRLKMRWTAIPAVEAWMMIVHFPDFIWLNVTGLMYYKSQLNPVCFFSSDIVDHTMSNVLHLR